MTTNLPIYWSNQASLNRLRQQRSTHYKASFHPVNKFYKKLIDCIQNLIDTSKNIASAVIFRDTLMIKPCQMRIDSR